jgi:hypothetical protein
MRPVAPEHLPGSSAAGSMSFERLAGILRGAFPDLPRQGRFGQSGAILRRGANCEGPGTMLVTS